MKKIIWLTAVLLTGWINNGLCGEQNVVAQTKHVPPYKDICEAAKTGTVQDVETFVKNGLDINTKCYWGLTPLHQAVRYNTNTEVVTYLLNNGADVNAKDDYGITPLHNAIDCRSSTTVIKLLIDKGADVNAKTGSIIDALKSLIVNASSEEFFDNILLFIAIMNNGNEDILTHLIEIRDAEVINTEQLGITPLHIAIVCFNKEALEYLIEKGADVNAVDGSAKTPLDYADTDEKKNVLRKAGAKSRKEL